MSILRDLCTYKSKPAIKGEFSKNVHARSEINEHHALFIWKALETESHQNKGEKIKKDEDVRYGNRFTMRESKRIPRIMVNERYQDYSCATSLESISPDMSRRMEGHRRDVAKKKNEIDVVPDVFEYIEGFAALWESLG